MKPCFRPLVLWTGLVACADVEHYGIDLPSNVSHVAMLELLGGAVVASTPLIRWDPEVPLEIAIGASNEGLLVGFAAKDLEAVGGREGEIEQIELRPADGSPCALGLPAPSWAGRWRTDGAFEEAELLDVPRVTASWVRVQCQRPEAVDLRFDLRGAVSNCEREPLIEEIDGCRHQITLCGETEDASIFVLGDRGQASLCVEAPSGAKGNCRAASFDAPAIAGVQCDRLGVFDALDVTSPGPDRVTATTFNVALVPRLDPDEQRAAGVFDFVVLSDRVVVSRSGEKYVGCSAEAQAANREFASFDLDTGALAQTATVPPCFSMMASDAAKAGVVAAYFGEGSFRLGHFDLVGHETVSVALPFPGSIDENVDVRGLASLPDGTLGVLISRITIRADDTPAGVFSRFFLLSLASLEFTVPPLDFEDPLSTPMRLGTGPAEFLLAGGWSQKLTRVSSSGQVRELLLPLEGVTVIGVNPLVDAVGLSDGSLAASGQRAPVRFVTAQGERWEEGPTFDNLGIATAGIEWPAMGPGVLTFVAQEKSALSQLILIDTRTRRVMRAAHLPASTYTPRLLLGRLDELWALDGPQGELHRFTAR